MAVKDVKEYYYEIQAQYLEMKNDLVDFDQALKDGYITEEKMQEAIDSVNALQINYDRLTYIMYLLELPKRKKKQAKYNKMNKKLLDEFQNLKADKESVKEENKSALTEFKNKLKKLTNKQK